MKSHTVESYVFITKPSSIWYQNHMLEPSVLIYWSLEVSTVFMGFSPIMAKLAGDVSRPKREKYSSHHALPGYVSGSFKFQISFSNKFEIEVFNSNFGILVEDSWWWSWFKSVVANWQIDEQLWRSLEVRTQETLSYFLFDSNRWVKLC